MPNCPYLIFVDGHCASCRGWRCTAKGRQKKVDDAVDMCKDETQWVECPRYLSSHPKPVEKREFTSTDDYVEIKVAPRKTPRVVCPYLGPVPPGERGCCGVWCYARNVPLRSAKHCRSRPSWLECRFRLEAYRNKVKKYTSS